MIVSYAAIKIKKRIFSSMWQFCISHISISVIIAKTILFYRSRQHMLKVTVLEIILRLIPEGFLFMFASYTFSKCTIIKSKLLISSLLLGITTYIIRSFPINFGVHSVLGIVAVVMLTVNINKIDIIKSISAAVITMIIGFLAEGINVFIIQSIMKEDISKIFEDPVSKSLYGIPSLLIMALIIGTYYFRALKNNELTSTSHEGYYK